MHCRSGKKKMQTAAIPGARFVDPKILARIGNLELLARNVVEGFINGLHRAPYIPHTHAIECLSQQCKASANMRHCLRIAAKDRRPDAPRSKEDSMSRRRSTATR